MIYLDTSVALALPVRTLDGIHLATTSWLRHQGNLIEIASYDSRLLLAAAAMDLPAAPL